MTLGVVDVDLQIAEKVDSKDMEAVLSTSTSSASLASLHADSVYYTHDEWVCNYAACDVAKIDLEEWCLRE